MRGLLAGSLAALLGLCGQSIALIKGGLKHQLKSTGPLSRRGVVRAIFPLHYVCVVSVCVGVCVCARVYVLVRDELLSHGSPFHSVGDGL